VDVQTVWHCNLRDIKMSTDSGQTWESTGTPGHPDCKISFVDQDTGWVISGLQLRATDDGGATWNELDLPGGIAKVTAISLRTADAGYLMTSAGTLYKTVDGGESWSSLPLDLAAYGEMGLLPSNLPSAAIRFFDADNGVVVVSLAGGGQSQVLALRTSDGGLTWEEEPVPVDIGVPYLTRDGEFLTIHSFLKSNMIFVAQYKGL
jgi:photosystem II stability/assembly factor-like uncharacterized protein